MSLFRSFVATNDFRERIGGRIVGEIGASGNPRKRESIVLDDWPRHVLASSLAVSVIIAGLCSFVTVAAMAAWAMLNQ